jgi:hypothetical protein
MCKLCGTEWKKLSSHYPCGPCPEEWECKDCGEQVSPCCGASIIEEPYDKGDETHLYCGNEACSECGVLCHCGGCI